MVTSLADVPPHVVAPSGVELKQSGVADNETGAWCTEKVTQGSKFGPFVGRTLQKGKAKKVDYRYAWEVINLETNELAHIVDATDPQYGNWMRFVNCARYLEEQNLVSIQEGLHIYYRAIRDIDPGEELLTWYSKEQATSKQRKPKGGVGTTTSPTTEATPPKIRKKPGPKPKVKDGTDKNKSTTVKKQGSKLSNAQEKQVKNNETVKGRPRKKALSKDYIDGQDLEDLVALSKQTVKDGIEEGVVKEYTKIRKTGSRGRGGIKQGRGNQSNSGSIKGSVTLRGRGRGKSKLQNSPSKKSSTLGLNKDQMKVSSPKKSARGKAKVQLSPGRGRGCGKKFSMAGPSNVGKRPVKPSSSKEGSVEMSENLLWLVKEASMNSSTPVKDGEYNFEILPIHHITGKLGRKMYKCDICAGIYRHAFSLKRHYLRNHIYCYYLSEADVSNCKILVAQQEAAIKNKPKNLPRKPASQTPSVENRKDASSSDKSSLDGDVEKSDSSGVKRGRNSLQTRPQPVCYPGLYRCYTCNKLYDYIEDLKSHTQDHPSAASEKLFSCSQCSMKFSYKQNLMRHQAVHSGIRPYSCKKCNRSFSTATSLKKHERIHMGKIPKCKYCKAVFNWRAELKRHMQKVHSEYLHHCPYCEKSFLARCAFQRHLTTHEDDPYLEPKVDSKAAPIKEKKKSKETNNGKKKSLKERKSPASKKSPTKKVITPKKSKPKPAQFKFACTVCKKRFSSYVNMCRHRRLAHPEEPKSDKPNSPKTVLPELEKIREIKIEENVVEPEEWRPCDTKFFASVADNIAFNLCNHIDGGESSIKEFSTHIRIKDYKSIAEVHDLETEAPTERDQIWTKYNFPSGYEPIISPEELSDGTVVALNLTTKRKEEVSEVPEISKLSTPLLIKIPEYHRCSVCSCVFSNTENYDWHMKEHHQTNPLKDTKACNNEIRQTINCDQVDVAASYLNPGLVYGQNQTHPESDKDSVGHSPLQKYEEVQFGVNGELKFVCGVCKKEFLDTLELGMHQYKKHPTIDCTYLEVENGFSVESLYYPAPIPTGELAEVKKKPIDSRKYHSFTCTRCLSHFSTVTRLYIHIINCAPKPKVKSLPGRTKRQFANQRSPVVKNRFQETEKKGKPEVEVTLEKVHGKDKKPTVRGIRQRKGEPVNDSAYSDIFLRRRKRGGLRYNPTNHVRRRETIDVLERHQCNGCGCKFQTISLLERHIKKCEEKEKLKSVKPLKRNSSEQFKLYSKLTCRYCARQFTYLKFLVNHYRDFCRVKKDKVMKGTLTDEDLQDENRIKAAALSAANHEIERRESSEVAMNAEGSVAKRGWPRGVKRKKGRKNHCWTYIKKRKSPDFASQSLRRSLRIDSAFDIGTPNPSCRLTFDKVSEYSEDSSQDSNSQASKETYSVGTLMEAETSETSSSSLISSDQAKRKDELPMPVLKRKKFTLLDFKIKAQNQQEIVPFDPSFLPMQQNKSYKQRQLKHANKMKQSGNIKSARSPNSHLRAVQKLPNDNSSSGTNLPERLTTLYGLMPKESTITIQNVEKTAEEMLQKPKSLTNERNLSLDSGLGSPNHSESQGINLKDREVISDVSGLAAGNNAETVEKIIQESNAVPTNDQKNDFKEKAHFCDAEQVTEADHLNKMDSGICVEAAAAICQKQIMKKETEESFDTKLSTSFDPKETVSDIKDSSNVEPAFTNGEKNIGPIFIPADSETNTAIKDIDCFCEAKPTPLLDGDGNSISNHIEDSAESKPTPLTTVSKVTGKRDLDEADSSDEDNMVLQRFVDLKSKLNIESENPPTSEKLPKNESACPKTTKSEKKKMIQTTLLNMFSTTKSVKSKSKLSIQTKSKTVTCREKDKIENTTMNCNEGQKKLDTSESSRFSKNDSYHQCASTVQEIPCDNSNSCNLESEISR